MKDFNTKRLPVARDQVAPDGSDVRVLLGVGSVLMAHYELPPEYVSTAVANKTVEEIWFVLSGRGEMWRKQGTLEETVPLEYGVCVTIPLGTAFQFRSVGYEALSIVGITVPPWPSPAEARVVQGKWEPTAELNLLNLRETDK